MTTESVRNTPVRYMEEPVISYAQNLEDVLLFRGLLGKRAGFYVDVGAGNPNWDSVTNWFYRIGWNGINIEPNPLMFSDLAAFRARDINLNIGIHAQPGTLKFYQVLQNSVGHGWGLSSFDPKVKELAARLGFEVRELPVETVTLASVLDRHAKDRTIDFLKIDVEGLEATVLASCDFRRYRPRVLCIEAIASEGGVPTHQKWEPELMSRDYLFAAFDGLNNYYVRNEDSALLSQFQATVNVHDRYRRGTAADLVGAPPGLT
jgi:FkbM family methyltransferase